MPCFATPATPPKPPSPRPQPPAPTRRTTSTPSSTASPDAADSIRRAAAHAATALAVHIGLRHNTTRRLQIALTDAIFCDHLRRGHLRTFRHTYTLAAVLNLPTPAYKIASLARAAANAGHAGNAASAGNAGHVVRAAAPHRRTPHSTTGLRVPIGHTPTATTIQTIRKMRKRVASLKNAIAAIIAGPPEAGPPRQAQPPLRHRLRPHHAHRRRNPVRRRNHPLALLPEIREAVQPGRRPNVHRLPTSTPNYGSAARRLCRCAPEPRHLHSDHDHNIILVPQWRQALTDAYPHLQIPHLLPI